MKEKQLLEFQIIDIINTYPGAERGITWAEVLGGGINEVEQAGAAVEFGEEEGGVGLGLRRVDPLKAGSDAAIVAATFPENAASVAAQSHGAYCLGG